MTEQLPLFQRKHFPVTLTQGIPITPPGPESSVLSTLPAYYIYLQSQGYSQYTPADFCGDVKKFSLFVHQKTLQNITTQDIQQFVSILREKERLTDKTISRKLTVYANEHPDHLPQNC
jgi:site-specific recombinase XerC